MTSIEQQHKRFTHQVQWTTQVRDYLLRKASLDPGDRLIEVGCGTGAVLKVLPGRINNYGLDINLDLLAHARALCPQVPLTGADVHRMPFPPASFEAVCCHFLLLWVANPLKAVSEMVRICKPGGAVLILAEPDYGGRIDHPAELAALGEAQTTSLKAQGANPLLGRTLPQIMKQAGLKNLEIGIINSQWRPPIAAEQLESEVETLRLDLETQFSTVELDRLINIDRMAWNTGSRVLFVPTFYAFGEVQ